MLGMTKVSPNKITVYFELLLFKNVPILSFYIEPQRAEKALKAGAAFVDFPERKIVLAQ